MRVIVEIGPQGSGIEFSLPLHKNGKDGSMLASAVLEELNNLEEDNDAGEMTFIPSCAATAGSSSAGKEN